MKWDWRRSQVVGFVGCRLSNWLPWRRLDDSTAITAATLWCVVVGVWSIMSSGWRWWLRLLLCWSQQHDVILLLVKPRRRHRRHRSWLLLEHSSNILYSLVTSWRLSLIYALPNLCILLWVCVSRQLSIVKIQCERSYVFLYRSLKLEQLKMEMYVLLKSSVQYESEWQK